MVKNQTAKAGDPRDVGLISPQEDSLEKEMANHSNILAGIIPWTERSSGLYTPHGVTKSWMQLSTSSTII